jgi:hypothetical protein
VFKLSDAEEEGAEGGFQPSDHVISAGTMGGASPWCVTLMHCLQDRRADHNQALRRAKGFERSHQAAIDAAWRG